jgi:hypothetical protein
MLLRDQATQTPISLVGKTARMQIRYSRASSTVIYTLTTANGGITLGGVLGTIVINLTPAQTAALLKSAVYDLELVNSADVTSDGNVDKILFGDLMLVKEVTR